jgi:hypothetical protein
VIDECLSSQGDADHRSAMESLRNHALSLVLALIELAFQSVDPLPKSDQISTDKVHLIGVFHPRFHDLSRFSFQSVQSPHESIASSGLLRHLFGMIGQSQNKVAEFSAELTSKVESIAVPDGSFFVNSKARLSRLELLNSAFGIAREKSLEKAIMFLIEKGELVEDAQQIASFVHRHADSFELECVGDFLGGTRQVLSSSKFGFIIVLFKLTISFQTERRETLRE